MFLNDLEEEKLRMLSASLSKKNIKNQYQAIDITAAASCTELANLVID